MRGLGPASVGGVVVVLVLIVSSGLPSEVTDIMTVCPGLSSKFSGDSHGHEEKQPQVIR